MVIESETEVGVPHGHPRCLRTIRRVTVTLLLLAGALPIAACINTEAETLYEDVEITRKDEASADTLNDR